MFRIPSRKSPAAACLLALALIAPALLILPAASAQSQGQSQQPPGQSAAPPADLLSYVTDILPQRQRDLWIMRVDGSDKKQLTRGFNVWFASWSPDGKKIAVTTEGTQIYTVNADGSDLKLITGGAYSPPFWSPDGHFIAYTGGEKFGTPVARGNLRIVPAAGGQSWIVPGGEDIPSLPPGAAAVVWSPDGTRIACGWPGRILSVAGGPNAPVASEPLPDEGAGMFVVAGGWAPDGKHLAVTDGIKYGILDLTTGKFVTIATSVKQPGIARPGVSWSAALQKVAYSINSAGEDGQRLFLANLDGSNPKLILSAPHLASYNGEVSDYGPPFFSADSKTMLMRVSRTRRQGSGLLYTHESWLVNTDGSGGHKLLDGFNATWQPKTRLKLPDPAFWFQWRVADLPVANGQTQRSWLWGPTAIYSGTEPFSGTAGGQMSVVYFDKGRMEIANPSPPQPTKYLVTNGTLAKELVTGQVATGPSTYDTRQPSDMAVAGDDPNAGPSYATFNKLGTATDAGRAQDRTGQPIDQTLTRDGTAGTNADLGKLAKVDSFVARSGHNLPDVFAAYLKAQSYDWIYVAGYPVSEPYWVHVAVGGQQRDVLVQIFERRTLTYDPGAPKGYQVQYGNVGRHYYDWRYGGK